MDQATLLRLAGIAALAAGPVLALSGVALALFFGGRGERWGPINDVLVAIALVLLAPALVAVSVLAADVTGPWVVAVSLLGLAGIALAAGGQLLLVAGRIDLQTSFVTGGLGMLALLPWALGVIVLAFWGDVVSDAVGALLALSLVLVVLTAAVALVTRGPALWAVASALGLTLTVWLMALGLDLLGQADR